MPAISCRREDDKERIGPCRIIITRCAHGECKPIGGLQIVVEIRVTSSAAETASCRNAGFRPGRGNFGPRGAQKYQKAKCHDQSYCYQRGGLARNANSHRATSAFVVIGFDGSEFSKRKKATPL